MDPLSMTASVIAILQLTSTIISSCSAYISAVKDAPKDLRTIRIEIRSLEAIVRVLDLPVPGGDVTRDQAHSNLLENLQGPDGPLDGCRSALKALQDLLEEPKTSSDGNSNRHTRRFMNIPSMTTLAWPLKRSKANSLIEEIAKYKSTISLALTADSRLSTSLLFERMEHKNQEFQDQQQMDQLRLWLAPSNVSENHSSATGSRCPGTCLWIFGHSLYKEWSNNGGILWVNGTAGSGKTVISSAVIQQLQLEFRPDDAALAYFYFDYTDIAKRSIENLLSTVIWQLANQQGSLMEQLLNWASTQPSVVSLRAWQAPPNSIMLENLLVTMTKKLRLILVVDAVDESTDMKAMTSLLLRLQNTSINILFTSRPDIVIRRAWTLEAPRVDGKALELAILPQFVCPDIEIYVSDEIDRLIATKELTLRDPALRLEIIESLANRSDGMFQWASCHLGSLCDNFSDRAIRQAIMRLPQGLENTYQDILNRLQTSSKDGAALSRRLFQWVAFAYRPLTLSELCVAICLEDDDLHFDPSNMISDPWNVLKLGGNLLVHESETHRISFAHHTVRDFLTTRSIVPDAFYLSEVDSHVDLASTCLRYLKSTCVIQGMRSLEYGMLAEGQWHEDELSFVHYAARFWIMHTRDSGTKGNELLSDLVYSFIYDNADSFVAWQGVYEAPVEKKSEPEEVVQARFYTMLGIQRPTFELVETTKSYSAANSMASESVRNRHMHLRGSTALFSSERRLLSPLNYLVRIPLLNCLRRALKEGDSPNRFGGLLMSTPLHDATKNSEIELSNLLLDNGAEVDAKDLLRRTPLLYASQMGHIDMAKLLISRNARPNCLDWYKCSPLHDASRNGHTDIVKLLVKHNANLEAIDAAGDTPLSLACQSNHNKVASILLESGARPNLVAVKKCLDGGFEAILELVMRYAAADRPDLGYEPLLHTLSERNSYHGNKPLQVLLDCGYPIDARNSHGKTALFTALEQWNLEAADYLFTRGADPSTNFGRTTCLHVLGQGHIYLNSHVTENLRKDLVVRLIRSGCALEARDKEGRTALIHALISRSFGVAATLLEAGADGCARDVYDKGIVDYFDTRQHWYWQDDSENAVIAFLSNLTKTGASLNVQNAKGQTLLHLLSEWYMSEKNTKLLCFILGNGGNPSLTDSEGRLPLHCLLSNPYPCASLVRQTVFSDILAQFIRGSGNINICAGRWGTPLHGLVRFFFETFCSELLDSVLPKMLRLGADRSKVNHLMETPAVTMMRLMANSSVPRPLERCIEMIENLIPPSMEAIFANSEDIVIRGILKRYWSHQDKIIRLLMKSKLTVQQVSVVLDELNIDAAEALLGIDFNINSLDRDGNTLLHRRVVLKASNKEHTAGNTFGKPEVYYSDSLRAAKALILLQHGADPNIQNARGDTALHSTCRSERKAYEDCGTKFKSSEFSLVLQHLLAHGAKVDIKNEDGLYPWELLRMSDFAKEDQHSIRSLLRLDDIGLDHFVDGDLFAEDQKDDP